MNNTVQSEETPAPERADIRTFLIADVRGYTRFTVEHGDEAAAQLAARFADLVEATVTARGGRVIELRGDEALAVFSSAREALRTSIALQTLFEEEARVTASFKVGIGLDAGEAIPIKGGFRGAALNLAARLCNLAGAGEVLVSEAIVHLAGKIEGLEYVERGSVQFKGFSDPVRVVRIMRSNELDDAKAHVSRGPDEGDIEHSGRREQQLPIGGFLGSLPSGALVSRDEDLHRILTIINTVVEGEGRLIMLAGEPGVGKTRLAQEVTLTVRNRGFLIAAGSCYESEQGTQYYPFLDALAAVYDAAPAAIRAAVPQQWPYLGKLLPNHSIPAPTAAAGGQEEQQRLLWSVTGFLQAVAVGSPVGLLLDDLHWADGSSLALLQHLARHTRSHRILLLGIYRDVDIGRHHPLESVLLDLSRQQVLERIAVRRMSIDGTAALMAATLGVPDISQEFATLLHRHTEGNPFFLQEVLRALIERGDIYQENGQWARRALEAIEVPESVRAVVGQRLSRLSHDTQALLHEASVLGTTFVFDDLQHLDGRTEDQIERALEEAVAAGITREAGRDTYAFNHALTQHALYAELSSRRKRRLHLAAGEALERLPERVRDRRLAELALHFQEADDAERALHYSMLVGDRAAAAFAHEDAARYYHAALELAQQADDIVREAEVYEKLGGLFTATIRYADALEMLEHSAELFGTAGNRESEGRVIAQIGRVYFSMTRTEEGVNRLEPALASMAEDGSPRALAGLVSVLAKLYFARGRYREALTSAEGAAEQAASARENGVLAEAQITRGSAMAMLGQWRDGLTILEGAIEVAESASDIFSVCRALQSAAAIYLVRGELVIHREYMERALAVAQRMHNQRQVAATSFGLSINAFISGDWRLAHERADGARHIMDSLGATWRSAFHLVGLAALAVAEGHTDLADRCLQEALDISASTGDAQTFQEAQEVLAEKELVAGWPQRAQTRLESLLAENDLAEGVAGVIDSLPGHYLLAGTHHATGLLPLLGWAYLEVGETAQAEEMAAAGIGQAAAEDIRMASIEWNAIRAVCLGRRERWKEAAHGFEHALILARSIPYPYMEARVMYECGRVRMLHGDQGARDSLDAALTIFHRLGAQPYIERTSRALAALGET